jgi:hypothetical protein
MRTLHPPYSESRLVLPSKRPASLSLSAKL